MPISFNDDGSAFKLTRLDPPTLSEEDQQIIAKMINFLPGNKDVRTEL